MTSYPPPPPSIHHHDYYRETITATRTTQLPPPTQDTLRDREAKTETSRSCSKSSVDSDSSATERRQWRNHPPGTVSPIREEAAAAATANHACECTWPRTTTTTLPFPAHVGENAETLFMRRVAEKDQNAEKICGEEESLRAEMKLGFRERIRHFTFTWFTMTMATGGIANVLYTVPFRFHGLYTLGCFFFLLNIVLFLFNLAMISCRFYFYPKTFKASFLHPTESLFIPAVVVSFGIILINITQYGVGEGGMGKWFESCMIVLFWLNCGLAVVVSVVVYLILWSTTTFTISQMTPVWIFPAYSCLIAGPHAGNLASKVSNPNTALTIILGGFVILGIGFLVSLMIYAAFIYRLMTQKLPRESLRPGMFVSVGPSGFTISGIITMGLHLPKVVPPDFMGEGNGELAGRVGMICANFVGLWLWGLAFWFFFVSVGAHFSCAAKGKLEFAMAWYSFVFPNTALTTATFSIARALNGNKPIEYIGCVMTAGLIMMWLFVIVMNIRAVIIRHILWPHKQEDRTEGGWTQQSAEEQRRKQDEERGRGRSWSTVSVGKTLTRIGTDVGYGGRRLARARTWSIPRTRK